MTKKIGQFLYLLLLTGAIILAPVSVQAYSAVAVKNAAIKLDEVLKNVTVTGSISTGTSSDITVKVTDSKEAVVFVDQIRSGSNGSYVFTFRQPEWLNGKYFIRIGGEGVDVPYEGAYEITTAVNSDISNVNVSLDEAAGKVKLSGVSKSGEGKFITVKLINPEGNLAFLDQTVSEQAGKFSYTFKLNNWIIGKYVYQIGVEGVELSYSGSFDIASKNNGNSGGSTNNSTTSPNIIKENPTPENSIIVKSIDGAKVTINYSLKKDEDPSKVVVYYIGKDGTKRIVKNGRYNTSTGKVEFKPGIIGNYVVGYNDIKFNDVSSDFWARDSINGLAAREIISGTGNNIFNPNGKVTRAEFLKILMETFELIDNEAKCTLSGVAENTWYYGAVASAQKLGIISGKTDGSFGANEEITRQDMALILYRTYQTAGYKLNANIQSRYFKDAANISEYAAEAVQAMQKAGIISGFKDGKFAPKTGATRAEAATMIYKLLFNN